MDLVLAMIALYIAAGMTVDRIRFSTVLVLAAVSTLFILIKYAAF
ncbi:hypothetical protein [Kiritimatiella glycovorans]|uniref:Uncharacterized protein n=1 Tax=Kiritimatiella glycovorans TaxID=1307763 RepID=A0A0G3EES9_9BACT|nr:hypothetical protein [Kiritimatiella glycovorans]AKJ63897.1 hypothetical protein L21SP4_00628 [Kiritimatiella glycovorans]